MWRVWVDTGGTFTDCLALDPAGRLRRAKVLSSSALRGRVVAIEDRVLHYRARWRLPDGFARGAELHFLNDPGGDAEDGDAEDGDAEDGDVSRPGIAVSGSRGNRLELAAALPSGLSGGQAFELRFDEEAPILAARLVTGTAAEEAFPPLEMRLATTRGTNALLERTGARCVFFVTRGFADLLVIGDQSRPDLFALDPRRPPPLYQAVIEVPERLAADGTVIEELDLEALAPQLEALGSSGYESAAIALLHSYRNPTHERRLQAELERRGFELVSASASLAPTIKILPRAETAVVDAYLAPIIRRYLRRVESALSAGRLQVMTSAGGLVASRRYQAKDSLLSGPAGGVVGAARSGREHGFERLIAFDMGGTSTDVSRFDGDFEYRFEHRVGQASVASPALAIETVAAGGGSICHRRGGELKVGPQSAGADPGPACYGAGGPLTLTDVNLLLGRLDPRRFGIPIQPAAAAAAATELLADLESADGAREQLLEGFTTIADERMADAIRRVSVRRGYDPADYTLVAFGGAGGQHACAVASLLGMRGIVAPREAGLLSAQGLGAAVVERFAQRQLLTVLEEAGQLVKVLRQLETRAIEQVAGEGVEEGEIEVRRRLCFLRFLGQEATLELEVDARGEVDGRPLRAAFLERYQALYGYRPAERPIEIDSLRVIASSRPATVEIAAGALNPASRRAASPADQRRAYFGGGWRPVPVFHAPDLEPGDRLDGPALVLDDYATLVVDDGWRARVTAAGIVLDRSS